MKQTNYEKIGWSIALDELERQRLSLRNHLLIEWFCVAWFLAVVGYRIISPYVLATHPSLRSLSDILGKPLWYLVIASEYAALILAIRVGRSDDWKGYREAFKQLYVENYLDSVFAELRYEPDQRIHTGYVEKTMIVPKRFRDNWRLAGNDYISGRYKQTRFQRSDLCLIYCFGKSNHSRKNTVVFSGRWMIVEFNKSFRSKVQIVQKGFCNSPRKRTFEMSDSVFDPVEMESADFNSRFLVYAKNEHEAFYLITPQLMERLQQLADRTGGKLFFCFVKNQLHIAIQSNKDSLEAPSVFKRLDEAQITQQFREEIEGITQFIDELSLDNNLFINAEK